MTTSVEWPQLLFDLFRLALDQREVQVWQREIKARFKYATNDEVVGAIRLWAKEQPQARWRDCSGLIGMISQQRNERSSQPSKPTDQRKVPDCPYCVKGELHFNKLGVIEGTYDEPSNNTVPCTCAAGENQVKGELWSGQCDAYHAKIYREFAPEVRRWKDGAPKGSEHRPRGK